MINPLSNARIRNMFFVTVFAFMVIVTINFIGVGKSDQLDSFNSIINVVTAGLATALCWFYWSKLNSADPIKRVWRVLGIGLGLWTIAEAIWSVLILLGGEIAYPSVADILWVIGYPFLFLPFFLLYLLLRITPSGRNIAGIFGFAIIYIVVVSVYVIAPILQDPESSLIEKTLSALYPIGDLMITLGAGFLALALLGGAFSWVWIIIAAGFLSQSFSDTLFTYADWNGLYMPGGSSNLLSILVDTTYILGYMLVAFGIFVQIEFTTHEIEEPLVARYKSLTDVKSVASSSVKITLFVDEMNRIITASRSMAYLLPPEKDPLELHGTPYNQAIGLDFEFARKMVEEMKQKRFLSHRSVNLFGSEGHVFEAQISGIPNFNSMDRYMGADLIITMRTNTESLKLDEVKTIPADLSRPTAAGLAAPQTLEEELIAEFVVRKIYTLYIVASRFGGINVAKSMQRAFNANARRLNTAVKMDGPNIIFDSQPHDLVLCRELLRGIISYSIAITSLEVIKREIAKVEDGLDPVLIQAAKEVGLYGLTLEKM